MASNSIRLIRSPAHTPPTRSVRGMGFTDVEREGRKREDFVLKISWFIVKRDFGQKPTISGRGNNCAIIRVFPSEGRLVRGICLGITQRRRRGSWLPLEGNLSECFLCNPRDLSSANEALTCNAPWNSVPATHDRRPISCAGELQQQVMFVPPRSVGGRRGRSRRRHRSRYQIVIGWVHV